MTENFDTCKNSVEERMLFSRAVKAGKRVYYIDVKRDRNDEFYISMTESKRVKEGSETERPQFEKHKIFLYREDILKFLQALTDAAQYVGEHRSLTERPNGTAQPTSCPTENPSNTTAHPDSPMLDAHFEVEF